MLVDQSSWLPDNYLVVHFSVFTVEVCQAFCPKIFIVSRLETLSPPYFSSCNVKWQSWGVALKRVGNVLIPDFPAQLSCLGTLYKVIDDDLDYRPGSWIITHQIWGGLLRVWDDKYLRVFSPEIFIQQMIREELIPANTSYWTPVRGNDGDWGGEEMVVIMARGWPVVMCVTGTIALLVTTITPTQAQEGSHKIGKSRNILSPTGSSSWLWFYIYNSYKTLLDYTSTEYCKVESLVFLKRSFEE